MLRRILLVTGRTWLFIHYILFDRHHTRESVLCRAHLEGKRRPLYYGKNGCNKFGVRNFGQSLPHTWPIVSSPHYIIIHYREVYLALSRRTLFYAGRYGKENNTFLVLVREKIYTDFWFIKSPAKIQDKEGLREKREQNAHGRTNDNEIRKTLNVEASL